MIGLYFAIIVVVCYLIGNINFARIVVSLGKKEDITKKGSGNPGTMNVMRNYGILLALLVLVLEGVKAGIPAIISATLMDSFGLYELAFFVAGASVVLGQVFPIFNKFKGGKGIACMTGMFFFTRYWWVAIIVFFFCAVILYLFDYAFLASLSFVTIMSVVMISTEVAVIKPDYLWIVILLISLIWLFAMFKHRSNFARFFANSENKTGFRHKILMAFSPKYREYVKQEEIKNLQRKEAVKKFIEEREEVREHRKEERKEERKQKRVLKKNERAERKEKRKEKRLKKSDKRVKKTKNGKRNPFRHHSKKKIEEDLT